LDEKLKLQKAAFPSQPHGL